MNPRQRVIAAVHHQEPDRVPIDLGGMRATGIMATAYAALKTHLGITGGDISVYDPGQQLAAVEEPVRAAIGCDVVSLDGGLLDAWRPYILPDGTPARIGRGFLTEPDGSGGEYAVDEMGRRHRHRPAASFYFDPLHFPLEEASSAADLESYSWPLLTDDALTGLQREARRLDEETEYAILGAFGGSFIEDGQCLRGWTNFMMDLAADRPFAEAMLDRLLDAHLRNVALYLDAVGDRLQIIQVGGDLGTQNGPQISPRTYEELIQPRQKAFWTRIHELAPHVAIFLHSCGGIRELLPGIIDAGCDILNPVQFGARGMNLADLKREFGNQLCFWGGGCDTQQVLPFGTPEEVYHHTRRNVECLMPGGGFVFCQVHNIQAATPPENIVAMFEAVRDAGVYAGGES